MHLSESLRRNAPFTFIVLAILVSALALAVGTLSLVARMH
jgi:hypothetical protein